MGLDEIRLRAEDAGIEIQTYSQSFPRLPDRKDRFVLLMPNGRDTCPVRVNPATVELVESSNFEHLTILGDYIATLDKSTGIIEALLTGPNLPFSSGAGRRLARSLKVGAFAESQYSEVADDDSELEAEDLALEPSSENDWKVHITTPRADIRLEICEYAENLLLAASESLRFDLKYTPRIGPCLRILGSTTTRHDDALATLERYSNSLLFDLDLYYGVALTVARRRPLSTRSGAPITPPRERISSISNVYARDAVAMYSYGRFANRMPLLQFLAYYQAVEFFFPSFSNAAVLQRLRLHLRDPRFDRDNDSELQRLISIARGSSHGGISEKEQLRATLDGSLDDDDLRTFLVHHENLTSPKQGAAIRGAKNFKLLSSERLIDQVTQRIYHIRCRIVHAKENGGDTGAEVLLPFGKEADSLRDDIALMRYVAQKVIISGSRGSL